MDIQSADNLDLRSLRAFYMQGRQQEEELDGLVPVALAPFGDGSRLRHGYPVVLLSDACLSLGELLRQLVDESRAGMLWDNLDRLELWVRRTPGEGGLKEAVQQAGQAMLEELRLPAAGHAQLAEQLDALVAALPEGARLAAYGRAAVFWLWRLSAGRVLRRQQAFREDVGQLLAVVEGVLAVERAKAPESRTANALKTGLAADNGRFDPRGLSQLGKSRLGAPRMDPEKRKRLEQQARTLREFLARPQGPVLIHDKSLEPPSLEGVEVVGAGNLWSDTERLYDRLLEQWNEVFATVRKLRAEIAWGDHGRALVLDPREHGLTESERRVVPPVLAVTSSDSLAGEGLAGFSSLVASGRAVQVLALTEHPRDPCQGSLDLLFLGLAHPQARVGQSSAARPGHLLEIFDRACDDPGPGLHLVLAPRQAQEKPARWLEAGMATECRAHPLVRCEPRTRGQEILELDGNPAVQSDWPVYTHRLDSRELELPVTLVDHALLNSAWRRHFLRVSEAEAGDHLVRLDLFLEDGQPGTYPFLWAVGPSGKPVRLAVSRHLVRACRDQRAAWRSLQELAGLRGRRLDEVRQQAEDQLAAERERLQQEQAGQLGRVRAEAVEEAMERLAGRLLSLDLETALQTAPRAVEHASAIVAEPEAPQTAPERVPEPVAVVEEPWVDSPMCTSCNDCMAVNPLLFVYDANRQVTLGDLSSGTYAELVQAAEKCPAGCIHPGLPLNPDEPGLEELKKRAEPFN